jgi:hypothetical protein
MSDHGTRRLAPGRAARSVARMDRIRPAFLLVVLLLAAASAATVGAAEGAKPELFSLEKLQAAGKQFKTLRVPFVQEKHLAILDEPVVNKGVLEVSRPLGAVRWEFTGRSVLLFKDGRIRRFGAEGKEETVAGGKDPSVQSMANQMRAFLDGDWGPMKEIFAITPDPGGAPLLTFTPLAADLKKYITKLEIRFRDDLTAPSSMLMVAAGDDRTEYRYDPPQIDVDIPASRFTGP